MIRPQHLLLLIGFIVLGCKSSKQSNVAMYPIITFEKTTCFGACPAYLFKAYPDGSVTYIGKDYVTLVGDFKASISKEELSNMKSLFEEADYFKFANVYSANITDLPTTYLYFDNGIENKKITDYHGAPESLKKLEEDVEALINSINWEKAN